MEMSEVKKEIKDYVRDHDLLAYAALQTGTN